MKGNNVIEIRCAKAIDVPQICEIYCEEENVPVTEEYVGQANKAFDEMQKKGDVILAAFIKEKLVGCNSVHFLTDLYPGYTEGAYLHIETGIIRKLYRGKGINTKLLKRAIDIGREYGCTYAVVQTGTDNAAARRSLEKAGFFEHNVNYKYDFKKDEVV